MAGLDPAIQFLSAWVLEGSLGGRVKPGHGEGA